MGNRNTDTIKIAIEYANLCDMRTLLKYAKNAAISEISGNSIGSTCMKLGLATGFTRCGGPAYWRYLAITVKRRCGFVSYRPTFFDHVLLIG